jgi:GNAT superfamily N-acetyltransferase
LTTRPLSPGDFDAWFPLWNQYLGLNGAKMRWPDRKALFEKLAVQQGNSAAVVVECNGKMVGIAHYQIRLSAFVFESAYHVQDVFILPEYQSHRAGAHLMRAVYQAAHQNGAPAVYWLAAENTYRPEAAAAATSPFLQFRKAA